MDKLFENWRGYIEEAAATNVQDFASFIKPVGGDWVIVLYNWKECIQSMKTEKGPGNSVKGYIHIGPSDWASGESPCNSPQNPSKAWDIKRAAAIEKVGPMLYDTALSFARLKGAVGVMPDRGQLSKDAERVWIQYYERGTGATGIKVKKVPLDAPPPDNKTDTPDDDCKVWGKRHPAVDQMYVAATRAKYMPDMAVAHKRVLRKLEMAKEINYTADEIETLIWEDAESLWDTQYSP